MCSPELQRIRVCELVLKYEYSSDISHLGQIPLMDSWMNNLHSCGIVEDCSLIVTQQVHRRGAGSRLMAKAGHLEGIVRCMLLSCMDVTAHTHSDRDREMER